MGAELARGVGKRMGLSPEEKDSLCFLVGHHLFMLETAFRRDLHDEQAILHFADNVRDLHQLKMLYLLTFADIKAVGPEAWTSWKNSLLMELFLKSSHFLENQDAAGQFAREDEMMQRLQEQASPEIISSYREHLPPRY